MQDPPPPACLLFLFGMNEQGSGSKKLRDGNSKLYSYPECIYVRLMHDHGADMGQYNVDRSQTNEAAHATNSLVLSARFQSMLTHNVNLK
jgi:hypothetical protein